MRALDRYAGGFILLLLYLASLPGRLFSRSLTEPVRTVIIQKFFGVGSIINAIPLLRKLRTLYPDAQFILVTFREQAEFVKISNLADKVVVIDHDTIGRFVRSVFAGIVQLRRERPQICIDLEFFSKFSMILSCLSGAPIRVGFFAYYHIRSLLLTHPASFNHFSHISRTFLGMAEALGASVEGWPMNITLPSTFGACKEKLEGLIGEIGEAPIVTINVNASMLSPLRAWPSLHFRLLLERLLASFPSVKFVLIGSAAEREYVNKIIVAFEAASNRVYNIAGQTTYAELMAVIERSHLLITNDSGPAHVAGAYGVDEIVLFGPETPVSYRPLNPKARVLYKPPFCSPCLNVLDNKAGENCKNNICMSGISVDEVYGAAEPIIAAAMGVTKTWKNAAAN